VWALVHFLFIVYEQSNWLEELPWEMILLSVEWNVTWCSSHSATVWRCAVLLSLTGGCVWTNIVAVEQIAEPPSHRRVFCYPVQLATPAPLPPATIERKEQGEMTLLTYRGDTQRLNTPYFHKLVSGWWSLVHKGFSLLFALNFAHNWTRVPLNCKSHCKEPVCTQLCTF